MEDSKSKPAEMTLVDLAIEAGREAVARGQKIELDQQQIPEVLPFKDFALFLVAMGRATNNSRYPERSWIKLCQVNNEIVADGGQPIIEEFIAPFYEIEPVPTNITLNERYRLEKLNKFLDEQGHKGLVLEAMPQLFDLPDQSARYGHLKKIKTDMADLLSYYDSSEDQSEAPARIGRLLKVIRRLAGVATIDETDYDILPSAHPRLNPEKKP
jgi:excinuclease UvrABC nuclease subunit